MRGDKCKANELPTQSYLHECFSYDDISGSLIRKSRPASHYKNMQAFKMSETRFAGSEAKTINGAGYITVSLDGRTYLAHRIIWKMVHGKDPNYIDHVNGIRTDNRIQNMRSISSQQNMLNRAITTQSTTGIYGVTISNKDKSFKIYITRDYKRHLLGTCRDFFEACCIRKSAEIAFGFHENHGRERKFKSGGEDNG